jgi:hypothetical protein
MRTTTVAAGVTPMAALEVDQLGNRTRTSVEEEEHRHEQVDEHGGYTRPDAKDVGALVRGGQRTQVAVARGTTAVTSVRGTLAEQCLAANK